MVPEADELQCCIQVYSLHRGKALDDKVYSVIKRILYEELTAD